MREIPLANGKGVAIVDDEDYERLAVHKWRLVSHGYAGRAEGPRPRRRYSMMHREVLGFGPGDPEIDHRNRDRLDNRRANLRLCSHQDNTCNQPLRSVPKTSLYKGVSRSPKRRKWSAHIKNNGRTIFLGCFVAQEEAAAAYDAAAEKAWGEFAATNRSLGLLSDGQA